MYTEKEIITALPFNYHLRRSVNYSFQAFDLEDLIAIMKDDKRWKTGEMNMMILRREPNLKIVLAILHEKTEIITTQVNASITFRIIEGKLMLRFLNESYILHAGELLTLNEKTRYRIDSIEETALLMTLNS